MRLIIILTAAALCGCASFRDPAASQADVRECQAAAKAAAWKGAVFGIAGAMVEKKSTWTECMAAKGYRTTAQR